MASATLLGVEEAGDRHSAPTPSPTPSEMTESEVRTRLEQMFRAHHELVWRTFRRVGLPAEAAADATQQVFLIAAERMSDIRLGSERAFLIGTALRVSQTLIRRNRRMDLDEDMDLRASGARLAEELTDQRRAVELMDRVLARLDSDLLTVFVLFELEGLSTAEIAMLLDIPKGTTASRLRRAREAFRAETERLERVARSRAPERRQP
ncbi:MAG: sigma-70 family RNA polymerase sigma factor [Myxococcota bacterium]|jgi:RNA polymerase sigma-70 factor, ECF subfamily|nr:sigma-70 family RNA polymerase sigma factor [Myxococcota bacterium]